MPDIDTSFYPKAHPLNLLETYGQAQGLANAQQQNQLLQTGNQQARVALHQSQVDLAHQQYGILNGALTSLAHDPRLVTDQAGQAADEMGLPLVKNGILTQAMFDQEKQQLLAAPPEQRPQLIQNMSVRALDGQSQFTQNYGTVGSFHTGNRTIPVATSPIMPVKRVGADIMDETGPDSRNVLENTIGPQGQTIARTHSDLVKATGNNALTGMPMGPAGQFSGQGAAQPSSSGQPQAGGGVVTSPPAGQVDALATQLKAGSEAYAQAQQRESTYQNDILPLTKSITQLQALGTTGSGPGTDTINQWKSFAQSMGIGTIAGIDPDKITSYDEAKKYLTSYASSIGGSGTNDKLAAAFAGNPSTTISNAAAVNVAKTALSMRRMQNAQVRAFSATGQSPGAYNQYAATFNASQDPVAYGADMMAPAARAKYYQGLSAPEKTKFLQSLEKATELGVISRPSAQ